MQGAADSGLSAVPTCEVCGRKAVVCSNDEIRFYVPGIASVNAKCLQFGYERLQAENASLRERISFLEQQLQSSGWPERGE